MQFQSYVYLCIFLPVVFLLYSLTRTNVLSKWVIVSSSVIFYGWVEPWFVIPMLTTGIVDYFLAQKIADSNNEIHRKRLLITSVVFNLGLLAFFKYTGWFTDSLVALGAFAGCSILTSPIHVPLPPGVSFYTFESVSYTVDVYKREFHPRRRLLDYLSFLLFFPHLVAGPIRRASQLLPVLSAYRPAVTVAVASQALFMILFGVFQKVVLADNFGGLVETTLKFISPSGASMPPGLGLIFTYAFCFQIYCDFAAYSTIARGTARLFGVELAHNFLTPYFSSNPSEFWRRWHISLSTWLRDYLYVPLGGNQGSKLKTIRNLLITMLLAGLWHGAGIFFIIWGLYHALLLILYRLVPINDFLSTRFGRIGRFISVVLFFHLVCIGWIFFRASPDQFMPIWTSIVAVPSLFFDNLANWRPAIVAAIDIPKTLGAYWPYIEKAIDIPHTLEAYWPYIEGARKAGSNLGPTIWATLSAIWERNIAASFVILGAALEAVWNDNIVASASTIPRALWASMQLNVYFTGLYWSLLVFCVPVILTDWIGYRRGCEFPELFSTIKWPLQVLLIILLIYGIQFYGRREGNAFIYFAF